MNHILNNIYNILHNVYKYSVMCDIGIGYRAPRSRGPHPEGDNSGRGSPKGRPQGPLNRGRYPASQDTLVESLLAAGYL